MLFRSNLSVGCNFSELSLVARVSVRLSVIGIKPQKIFSPYSSGRNLVFHHRSFVICLDADFYGIRNHSITLKSSRMSTSPKLKSKIPDGTLENKWTKYRSTVPLVNSANKRSIEIIVVGSGLAGSSAAATLAELGYKVKVFCFQDSPRRAHSIAAQGGINAAKNYQNDGDSVYRLFYDTIKGGDYRAREANVHRLAEVSGNIIDQCVAQGVPFAREYGGTLSNRSFGGTQVQRTFYAAGQTGQQLLLGAYTALQRQVGMGAVSMYARHEMLDVVVIDGKARGIIARDLTTGKLERHFGHADRKSTRLNSSH